MADPVLKAAYDKILEDLKIQMDAVNTTKKMLNMLAEKAGISDRFEIEGSDQIKASTSIKHDQFFRKKLATSVTEILNMRKEVMPLDEIINTLREGGYEMTTKDDEQKVRDGIRKNTTTFQLVKKEGSMYGMKSWYNERVRKPAESGAADEMTGDTQMDATGPEDESEPNEEN